jgi:hypothetical protein
MPFFSAILYPALVLLALGAVLLWNGPLVARGARAFPRSLPATVIFFGGGAAWFLWYVAHLGPDDFGDYKTLLLVLFGTVALGSFFVVRDFLAVRGLAILILLSARPILDSSIALDPSPPGRILLNSAIYIAIAVALYLGAAPYALRDFFAWLWKPHQGLRPRLLGVIFAACGFALLFFAMRYKQHLGAAS